MRSKLFQEKFMYSIEQQHEVYNENGEVIQKQFYSLKTFRMFTSAATAAWLNEHVSCDFERHVLTPWNVLQCYLESTLQVELTLKHLLQILNAYLFHFVICCCGHLCNIGGSHP